MMQPQPPKPATQRPLTPPSLTPRPPTQTSSPQPSPTQRFRRPRRLRRVIAPALVGAVALLIGAGFWKSPWAPLATLKHVAAAVPSCAVAEAVGVAPARQGQPGYWSHLDSDHDGIACPKQGQPQPQTASSRPKQGASIPVKQTATSTGKQTATSTAKGGQPTRGQGTAARTTAPTTQGKNTKQY